MILYHGSTITVENPEIIKSEIGRDFGSAFYTTDIKEQAVRWAKRKSMISSRKSRQIIIPVISVYEWSETPDLSIKKLHFVQKELSTPCTIKILSTDRRIRMDHYLIRATIIPEIVKLIAEKYNLTDDEALKAFYESSTGASLADDETGLYGQSIFFIFGLYMQEKVEDEEVIEI